VASLAALIKERLGIEVTRTPGGKGQFDVIAGGEKVVSRGGNFLTRQFGAGYPDPEAVIQALEARTARS
jgi:hypothetical protein